MPAYTPPRPATQPDLPQPVRPRDHGRGGQDRHRVGAARRRGVDEPGARTATTARHGPAASAPGATHRPTAPPSTRAARRDAAGGRRHWPPATGPLAPGAAPVTAAVGRASCDADRQPGRDGRPRTARQATAPEQHYEAELRRGVDARRHRHEHELRLRPHRLQGAGRQRRTAGSGARPGTSARSGSGWPTRSGSTNAEHRRPSSTPTPGGSEPDEDDATATSRHGGQPKPAAEDRRPAGHDSGQSTVDVSTTRPRRAGHPDLRPPAQPPATRAARRP